MTYSRVAAFAEDHVALLDDDLTPEEELSEAEIITDEIKTLIKHHRKVTAARSNIVPFCTYTDPQYSDEAHIKMLGEKLDEVEKFIETKGAEGIGRLIVTMPPRHGKTLTVSKRWPAYLLGRDQRRRIALISYGAELARDASRAVRSPIRDEPLYRIVFPGVSLSKESAAVDRWSLAGQSPDDPSIVAAGIGGPVTGRGFHVIIVDDPLKDRQEAESVTIRERHKEWYKGTLYDRLEPGGAIVVIVTRWHEEDIVGFLLDEMDAGEGDEWDVLNLPAIAEESDPLGREVGAALWPSRYPVERLLQIKRVLGSYDWESKFQGHPKPPDGAKIKRSWFGYTKPKDLPKNLHWYRYWDLAISSKEGASRTASGRVAYDETGNLYISGFLVGQWEWPEQKRIIKRTMLAEWPLGVEHGIEKALHGTAIVQEFRQDKELHGVAFRGVDVSIDKLTRALPWIALAEDKMVFLVEGPWNIPFLDEATVFTGRNDKYDDQIDAVSGAVQMASFGNLVLESGENPFYD